MVRDDRPSWNAWIKIDFCGGCADDRVQSTVLVGVGVIYMQGMLGLYAISAAIDFIYSLRKDILAV